MPGGAATHSRWVAKLPYPVCKEQIVPKNPKCRRLDCALRNSCIVNRVMQEMSMSPPWACLAAAIQFQGWPLSAIFTIGASNFMSTHRIGRLPLPVRIVLAAAARAAAAVGSRCDTPTSGVASLCCLSRPPGKPPGPLPLAPPHSTPITPTHQPYPPNPTPTSASAPRHP